MIGCVFNQEMMLAERRQRAHRLRWLYVGFILIQLAPLFAAAGSFNEWIAGDGFSDFFERFVVVHFALLALLTPALVAGAITEEKTSGTLQYLLTAYLRPPEIVLGKFLARIFHLVLMSLAGLPVIALFSGFGGVGELPLAILALSLALIFGLAAASLLASVWCRLTRDAILSIYLIGLSVFATLALTASPRLVALGDRLLPLRALVLEHGRLNWSHVDACVLTWALLGMICLMIASLRLRGAYLRQLRAVPRSNPRWLPAWRPRMRVNPVLWRERHVVGLAPLPWLRRWPRWLGCVAIAGLTLGSLVWALQLILPAGASIVAHIRLGRWLELREALRAAPNSGDAFYWHGLLALLAASLIVAVRASGCITEEREGQTWEALLQTPLTTRNILRGKQWGILGACLPYLISYGVAALAVALCVGAVAAAWTVLWLIATIFTGLFAAAVGIWCSARMQSSWLSLLATIGLLYGSWIAMSAPTALGAWFVQGVLGIIAEYFDWLVGIGPVVGVIQSFNPLWLVVGLSFVAAFWFLTHRLLVGAEKEIGKRDRARQVDPQHGEFHKRWLRHIMQTAGAVAPTDPALLQPVAMPQEPAPEPARVPDVEPAEDTDALLPVPPAFNPLQDYNQKV